MALQYGRWLLRQRPREAGKTQQDAANALDMARSQVSDYASGRKKMSLPTAVAFARFLGCHPDELYEWVEVPKSRKSRSQNE
jgi:transcriptional regulator with XRE-family HTH domain